MIKKSPRPAKKSEISSTEKSSRSQMADGSLRLQGGDSFEVLSGGELNPMAMGVMKEIGIDISG